jgi:hypothetical protein
VNTKVVSGNNDSWVQFMKLTQDARKRNQGISAQSGTAPQVNRTVSKTTAAVFQSQAVPFAKNISFNNAVPRVQSKILGGMFDTYV